MSSLKKNRHVKWLSGRFLTEFIDWRYSQSCWYFPPSFVNCCPSNLSGSLSPLTCLNKYTLYTILHIYCTVQCEGGGYGILGLARTDNHLPQSPCTGQLFRWRHFALSSVSLIFLWSIGSGTCVRSYRKIFCKKTLRKVGRTLDLPRNVVFLDGPVAKFIVHDWGL